MAVLNPALVLMRERKRLRLDCAVILLGNLILGRGGGGAGSHTLPLVHCRIIKTRLLLVSGKAAAVCFWGKHADVGVEGFGGSVAGAGGCRVSLK